MNEKGFGLDFEKYQRMIREISSTSKSIEKRITNSKTVEKKSFEEKTSRSKEISKASDQEKDFRLEKLDSKTEKKKRLCRSFFKKRPYEIFKFLKNDPQLKPIKIEVSSLSKIIFDQYSFRVCADEKKTLIEEVCKKIDAIRCKFDQEKKKAFVDIKPIK